MRRMLQVAVVGGAVLLGAPALAQDNVPQSASPQDSERPPLPQDDAGQKAPGRYTFNRVDNGVLRLDTQTGQVAICSARAVGWACEVVPEDRAALEKEIARLQDETAALKKQLAGLQASPARPADKGNGEVKLKLPTRDDIERARVFIEETWRNLLDMIATMQKDMMRKS